MTNYFYAFTAAGTICIQTKASTPDECWHKLLLETAHMPYKSINDLKKRGYIIDKLDIDL